MLLDFEKLISDRLKVERTSDSSDKISDDLVSATDLITPSFSYIKIKYKLNLLVKKSNVKYYNIIIHTFFF
jgi:hypothetical protein